MRFGHGLAAALVCAALYPSVEARAQAQPPSASSKAASATPADRAAAGSKFKAAEASFKRKDFARAALEFEESYAIVPHPNTLLNAAEAWSNGGNSLASAKAYLRLQADFPATSDASVAEDRLRTLLPRLAVLRLSVEPGGEKLQVDAVDAAAGMVVVEPGQHVVTARFPNGVVERRVTLGPGADVELEVTAAAPETKQPAPSESEFPTPVPLFVFTAGAALTVASGAVLLWSGLDTLAARDAFDESPTQDRLDDGLSGQTRTNVFIGITAGLAAVTGVLGIFTDWDGAPPPVAAAVDDTGGFASLRFEFR